MLLDTAKVNKAVKVLDKCLEELPLYQVPADNFLLNYISIYYTAGQFEKGNDLAWALAIDNAQTLRYIASLSPARRKALERDEYNSTRVLQMLMTTAMQSGQEDFAQEIRSMAENTITGRPVTSDRVNKNFAK